MRADRETPSKYLQWIEIDLDALDHNVRAFRNHLSPGTKFMAVVKKNAFGCGAVTVSRTAIKAGADYLGVHSLEEAIELREAGINAPLLVFGPLLTGSADIIVRHKVIPTVTRAELGRALSNAAQKLNTVVKAHVKVDTGCHRWGISAEETVELINYLGTLPNFKVVGLYTHFSSADEPNPAPTNTQLKCFLQLAQLFPKIKFLHAANSAATLQLPETHLNMVRVGISLYGVYPPNINRETVPLKPLLSLKTRVARIHSITAGEGVSYGLTWVAPRDSMLALIPFGYGYGLSSLLSNRGEVLIRGRRAPIRGRICMDQCVVEVTDIPGVQVDDEVVIIGRQGDEEITVDEAARLSSSVPNEVLTRISPVLHRLYLYQKS